MTKAYRFALFLLFLLLEMSDSSDDCPRRESKDETSPMRGIDSPTAVTKDSPPVEDVGKNEDSRLEAKRRLAAKLMKITVGTESVCKEIGRVSERTL